MRLRVVRSVSWYLAKIDIFLHKTVNPITIELIVLGTDLKLLNLSWSTILLFDWKLSIKMANRGNQYGNRSKLGTRTPHIIYGMSRLRILKYQLGIRKIYSMKFFNEWMRLIQHNEWPNVLIPKQGRFIARCLARNKILENWNVWSELVRKFHTTGIILII